VQKKPSAKSSEQLNFVRWRQILVDPQYGICFTSHFWRLWF